MNDLITRIKNIQNNARSIKWGSSMLDTNSVVIVVGHLVYKRTLYLKVTFKSIGIYYVSILKTNGEEEKIESQCLNSDGVIKVIQNILKTEFPSNASIPSGYYDPKFSSIDGELNGENITI